MAAENLHPAHVAEGRAALPIARYLPVAARVLMGLVFFVFGLDGFLQFMPRPSVQMSEGAAAFSAGLMSAGYMFPMIKGTEVIAGALLLSNRFVPLALALLAPVVVNIFAFHAFLAPDGMGVTMAILVLELYLAWAYRSAFRPMLAARAARATPDTGRADARSS